ncbi:MAG: enoyl-CoA hydratase-related protein [Pelovirga sp.]
MDTLELEYRDALLIIALKRPQCCNAVNTRMLGELETVLQQSRKRREVSGIILTGAGKDFAAGADLREIRDFTPLEAIRFAELGQRVCRQIENDPRPVLAAVKGYTLGGGLELALSCDFILAADTACFGFRELAYGVLPAFGGASRLARLIGRSRAKELLFGARMIDAQEALRIGLINHQFPAADLDREAAERLGQICGQGLLALQMGKEVINSGRDIPLDAACKMERDAFAVCFSTADQKEGMQAFIEKRAPRFGGN